ncbi:MAG: serine/threonine-protein kinase, partial [Solirubrobacteraceae bacterium]
MSSAGDRSARGTRVLTRSTVDAARTAPTERAGAGVRPDRGGPLVLDRYRLGRRLGSGAFGSVWLARDERLEREVAVKILDRERVGGRFEREARVAARLAHPAIVTLYEAAIDDDGAYLVSELVRGSTLDRLLAAGLLSDRQIVQIGISLCDALAHAHGQGVVHRDVKPSNVLIPDPPLPAGPPAKLTDFGIASVAGGDALTATGDVLGTLAYMAPEQAAGLEAGPAADLYALALVVYESLTGVNPLAGAAAQRSRRLGIRLAPLRRQRRDLPRELGHAIDLALRPHPRERGSVQGLGLELEGALELLCDEPGVVEGPWTRSRAPRSRDEPADEAAAWAPSGESGPEPSRDAERAARRFMPAAPLGWPSRSLGAAAAAATATWVATVVLTPPPVPA